MLKTYMFLVNGLHVVWSTTYNGCTMVGVATNYCKHEHATMKDGLQFSVAQCDCLKTTREEEASRARRAYLRRQQKNEDAACACKSDHESATG